MPQMPSIPYASPSMYSPDRGTERLIDLMIRRGDVEARGQAASGEIWGRAVQDVGQIAAGAVQQYGEQKEGKKRAEAFQAFISDGQWAQDPAIALAGAIKLFGPEEGARVARALIEFPKITEKADAANNVRIGHTLVGLEGLSDEEIAPLWPGIVQKAGPALATQGVPMDQIPPEWDGKFRKQAVTFGRMLTGEKSAQTPDQIRAEAQARAEGTAAGTTPKIERETLDQQLAAARLAGDQGAIKSILALKAQEAAATRAPAGSGQASYQAKEVLNDEGKPVLANFDSRTGRYIDPSTGKVIRNPRAVPSAEEVNATRKFKTARPVIRAVSELSERINTLQGVMAKASGEVEKRKASINLNDDVAEYESLVMGFTPLVARALGHTGVLTEQDVVSVRKLFPTPGDSKSLRDRKVARIDSIIGALEAGSGQGDAPAGGIDPEVQKRLDKLKGL